MRNRKQLSAKSAFSTAIAVAASFAASRAMGQTNIIQNGGFETAGGTNVGGVVADWNVFDATTVQDMTDPHSGLSDLYLNNTQAPYAQYVYQDTPAGSVTPGDVYTLGFFASGNFSNGGIGQFQLAFFNSSGPVQFFGVQNFFPGTTYAQYPAAGSNTFTAPAGATYAELQFWATTGAATGSAAQMHLDDVSLTTSSGGGGSGNTSSGASAWNIPGSGDWNVATNWTNGIPNGVDAEADLSTSITAAHTVYTDIPITLGTLNFNNTNTYVVTGAGSLTMQASTGSATVIVQQGTQKINLPLTIASNTTLNVSSGATLLISNPVTINIGDSLTATGSGTVTYQSTLTLGSGASLAIASDSSIAALSLETNATASLATSSNRLLLQTNSLSLTTGSVLNLANDDVIVHGGNLTTINGLVQSGYSNGTWQGTGINSSAAAADSTHLTALGVVQATSAGTFDGATVAPGDVLIRYTYYGDATLDGKVDGSDYSRIDNGALLHLTGWANGDFNYDGVVDGSDYTLIDNAYNTQGSQIASASGELATGTAQIAGTSAVPEPGTLSILSAAVVGLLRRRRAGNSW